MVTKYNLRRREALRGLRTGRDWIEIVERALWVGLLATAFVIGWLALPQLVEQYADERAAQAIAAEERARSSEKEAHRILAHVLNGRTVRDKDTGAMLFVQVSKQEGL